MHVVCHGRYFTEMWPVLLSMDPATSGGGGLGLPEFAAANALLGEDFTDGEAEATFDALAEPAGVRPQRPDWRAGQCWAVQCCVWLCHRFPCMLTACCRSGCPAGPL